MLELRQGVSRPQLVQIVDDQHGRFDLVGELRKDSVDQLIGVQRSRRRRLRLRIDRPRRATDGVQNDAPESLRIMLVAVHGYERDAAKVGRVVSPRAQQ